MKNYIAELIRQHPEITVAELYKNSSGMSFETLARNYLIHREFNEVRERWRNKELQTTIQSEIFRIANKYSLSPATIKLIGYYGYGHLTS